MRQYYCICFNQYLLNRFKCKKNPICTFIIQNLTCHFNFKVSSEWDLLSETNIDAYHLPIFNHRSTVLADSATKQLPERRYRISLLQFLQFPISNLRKLFLIQLYVTKDCFQIKNSTLSLHPKVLTSGWYHHRKGFRSYLKRNQFFSSLLWCLQRIT